MLQFRLLKLSKVSVATICIASLIIQIQKAYCAPCCARNSAVPALIVGDDEHQLNFSAAYSSVVAETYEEGIPVFGSPNHNDTLQTFRIEGATLVSDRYQIGLSLAAVNRNVTTSEQTTRSMGMGDTRINAGYDFLPEWSYSNWKPQGFLFSTITVPTGRSIYDFEEQRSVGSQVTGNGFFSLSVGSLLLKKWAYWDIFLLPEVHYSFSRIFKSAGREYSVHPGFGGSIGLGVGFSPAQSPLRIGMRLAQRADEPRRIPAMDGLGQRKGWVLNCDAGFDLAYLLNTTNTLMVSYTDQTLFGIASYSNLSRTVAFNFQHRWER